MTTRKRRGHHTSANTPTTNSHRAIVVLRDGMGDSSPPEYRIAAIEAALTEAEQRGEAVGYRRGLEKAAVLLGGIDSSLIEGYVALLRLTKWPACAVCGGPATRWSSVYIHTLVYTKEADAGLQFRCDACDPHNKWFVLGPDEEPFLCHLAERDCAKEPG